MIEGVPYRRTPASFDPRVAATRLRADMVYFETGKGGAVFSASSVGWNGALSRNGDRNAASRLTANVLRSFIER
jgi:N,N-dimethylformamidase